MTSPSSSPSRLDRELRALRRLLRVLIFLPLAVIYVLLLALAFVPLAYGERNPLVPALVVLVPVAFIVFARKRGLSFAWRIAGGYLLAAPVLAYLAADDATLRHPTSLEEIAPAFPGAEKSYEVLMRYGKEHPEGKNFRAPDRIFRSGAFFGADKPEAWTKWLTEHRADIEADWADLAPVRAWWDELATFDRIGDLTPGRWDAEIMAFGPVRTYTQHAVAIAGLQALDGQGDAAFATLQPLLEVSRKLEPSARTLVRFMIARVAQKMTLETAAFVLDHATVSPAARARFAAALSGGSGGEAGARRLIGIEYSFGMEVFRVSATDSNRLIKELAGNFGPSDFRVSLPRGVVAVFAPFVFNANRTFNLLGDLTEQNQDLAARRESVKLMENTRAFLAGAGRPRFKNLVGAIFIGVSMPALNKVTESYWKVEDLRTGLRERLAKK